MIEYVCIYVDEGKKEFYMFELVSKFQPNGDQPEAIHELVDGIENGKKHQVLLGATGTGKTFTIANVIKEVNKPTLVLAHNKTLAGQLYGELKELFPNNRVEYFVSYYDYYQPEAYVPSTVILIVFHHLIVHIFPPFIIFVCHLQKCAVANITIF